MKTLLVAEYRDGRLLGSTYDLVAFASQLGGESAMFLVGSDSDLPQYDGTLYLADSAKYGEFNPSVHKQLLLDVIDKEQPDMVVFNHSSYGWDLAPRVALAMGAAQISEVVDIVDGALVTPVCNAKLRREIKAKTAKCVVTLQAGAFTLSGEPSGTVAVEKIECDAKSLVVFNGYEESEAGGVDLSKAEIIVSAGRGIGKPENLEIIRSLAKALKGEYGASRPVVDSEWAEHNRQVGTTGQTVSPKLYVACGISGAIQHIAGMKKSEFIVAVNTDRDAPIGEVADVLVVADLKQFVPALTERLAG
ncbi:electron transfer flavoprotein subunit alpha/FixB family protein [Desulforhopalus singaporensis]|uniref:Electron transfer flavoprotein alpha subunit apoprotein n=1 Tax=Desulforhopalus singaporensis TaxID=91360 RepID=A0A1H0TEQ5_9BACT|nr:electron transfer flavoprotein subunit alpha/FixB family protein [Desulforhopalus singaporensis]SDP51996.1 electron transfer flavoprotein alpha subunit apoprotein [Desulforhopalus singaporensis]